MTFPEKVIEVDVPDCIADYNYVPIYVWSGVGILLVLAAVIIATTYIIQQNRTTRQQTEITHRKSCPNCMTVYSGSNRGY